MRRIIVSFTVVGLLTACAAIGPQAEIVGSNARESFIGLFDYVIYVDCTVRNNGAAGNIEVSAELTAGGSWKKRQNVTLSRDQEQLVSIEFPEVEILSAGFGGIRYQCSAS